jgi:hypothetical protein
MVIVFHSQIVDQPRPQEGVMPAVNATTLHLGWIWIVSPAMRDRHFFAHSVGVIQIEKFDQLLNSTLSIAETLSVGKRQ